MNKLPKYRQLIIATIGILAFVISQAHSGQAFAAQNVSDFSLTMVVDKSRAKIGENITYTATITNHGPDAALLAFVSYGLPDQLNFVSVTCGGVISSDGSFCEYSILQPGQSVTSTLIATPNPSISNHERKTLTVFAETSFESTDTIDPDTSNNSASVTVRVIGSLTHP